MRFDDMIATVLAQPCERHDQMAAQWRQLVDLLAQGRREGGGEEVERAYAFLRANRAAIDLSIRRAAARTLAGLWIQPDLFAFFAEDSLSVAAPLVAGAKLGAQDWLDLLPRLGPAVRSLLRHRTDLPAKVRHALGAFGPSDLILEGGEAKAPAAAGGSADAGRTAERSESQIRELVERIEAFRRHKQSATPEAPAPAPIESGHVEGFRWEAATDGIIRWVENAPRGPLVGQSIASIAERGHHGVDGQAAGAFEKRAPFRDARFSVAGTGPAGGDWRISGVPFFDPQRGSFLGYRGTARRPRLDEVARGAEAAPAGMFGTQFPADSLRQLIHELRTPLNAIIGFAEMIEGQYMGPAAAGYRGRAAEIMDQARRLLTAVDDLDTAARIETRRFEHDESSVDAVALLVRLHDSYERVAQQRGSRIAIEIAAGLPPARVELSAAERMFARILAATIGLAQDGETISATMALDDLGDRSMLCLSIDRPRAIAGVREEALLDPGYSPEGDWPGAPALGLGFALRLVRNLAEAVGGALVVGDARFSLYLPVSGPAERAAGQG